MKKKGLLSERPVARVLLFLGVVFVLISLLADSLVLTGLGWAAILASAVMGAFLDT